MNPFPPCVDGPRTAPLQSRSVEAFLRTRPRPSGRSRMPHRSGARALVLTLLIAFALPAATASATDKYAGEFLRVGAGARALGMGGAFLAVADDATAGYWNPAGLVYLQHKSVQYMHSEEQHSQVGYDFLGLALPQGGEPGKRSALGVSIVRLGVDDIPVTPTAEELRPGIDFEDGDGNPSTNLPTENNGLWDVGERLFLSEFDLQVEQRLRRPVLLRAEPVAEVHARRVAQGALPHARRALGVGRRPRCRPDLRRGAAGDARLRRARPDDDLHVVGHRDEREHRAVAVVRRPVHGAAGDAST